MKIIFSRKGFDSEYGEMPNPILPDGTLLSLPIPSSDATEFQSLTYKGKSYASIVDELSNGKKYFTNCHLDPDIRAEVIARPDGWKPAFGQTDAALSHLCNQGVGVGDLFLFFGRFREAENVKGKYQFVPGTTPKHVIWGYLQVGELLRCPTSKEYPWLSSHPHIDRESNNNVVFVARDTLSWDENQKGANVLTYKDSLVLTKIGMSASRWDLPESMRDVRISYHKEKHRMDGYFQSVAKGQEFVFETENAKVWNWICGLIGARDYWSCVQ
jgi:hypothetical protein